jgi:hypothetical protein
VTEIRSEKDSAISNKATAIAKLPTHLRRHILPSDNPFVTDVDSMIEQLNALGRKLAPQHRWSFRTSEAFIAEATELAATAKSALPVNSLYWRDQMGNWEAYAVMNTLRVIDLARSCVWALARNDSVCACLLARSALETSVAFVDAARTVHATINGPSNQCKEGILDASVNLRTTFVTSKDLEEYSLKTIFASRMAENEAIYNATNIMTIINRISKSPGQDFILKTYEILCEAAHPNLLGRMLYVQNIEPDIIEGSEIRLLSAGNGVAWPLLAKAVVAGLSWASGTQVSAFHLMAATIDSINDRLRTA